MFSLLSQILPKRLPTKVWASHLSILYLVPYPSWVMLAQQCQSVDLPIMIFILGR